MLYHVAGATIKIANLVNYNCNPFRMAIYNALLYKHVLDYSFFCYSYSSVQYFNVYLQTIIKQITGNFILKL